MQGDFPASNDDHATRREVPLRGVFSDSPTIDGHGTGDLGFDVANLPTPGPSIGCRNRSTPAGCNHARAPDAIHTQGVMTWCSLDCAAGWQAGVGFRLPCPSLPSRDGGCRQHSWVCRHRHPACSSPRTGMSGWPHSRLRTGPEWATGRRPQRIGSLCRNDSCTKSVRGRPPRWFGQGSRPWRPGTCVPWTVGPCRSEFPPLYVVCWAVRRSPRPWCNACRPGRGPGRRSWRRSERPFPDAGGVSSLPSVPASCMSGHGFWAPQRQIWPAGSPAWLQRRHHPPAYPGSVQSPTCSQVPPNGKLGTPSAYPTSWPMRDHMPSKWACPQGKSFYTWGTSAPALPEPRHSASVWGSPPRRDQRHPDRIDQNGVPARRQEQRRILLPSQKASGPRTTSSWSQEGVSDALEATRPQRRRACGRFCKSAASSMLPRLSTGCTRPWTSSWALPSLKFHSVQALQTRENPSGPRFPIWGHSRWPCPWGTFWSHCSHGSPRGTGTFRSRMRKPRRDWGSNPRRWGHRPRFPPGGFHNATRIRCRWRCIVACWCAPRDLFLRSPKAQSGSCKHALCRSSRLERCPYRWFVAEHPMTYSDILYEILQRPRLPPGEEKLGHVGTDHVQVLPRRTGSPAKSPVWQVGQSRPCQSKSGRGPDKLWHAWCGRACQGSSVPRRRQPQCGREICPESSRSGRDPALRALLGIASSGNRTCSRNRGRAGRQTPVGWCGDVATNTCDRSLEASQKCAWRTWSPHRKGDPGHASQANHCTESWSHGARPFPGRRSTIWGTPLGDAVGTQGAAVHPFPGELMLIRLRQQTAPSWRSSVPTPSKVLRWEQQISAEGLAARSSSASWAVP